MKIDRNFIPCPVDTGDELFKNGIFVFNITKMIAHILNNPDDFRSEDVGVVDFAGGFSTINEQHVDSVDVSKPVILAEMYPGRYILIDGNHRMEKASRTGIASIRAYKLGIAEHVRFLTSKTAYTSYVEYVNSKAGK